MFDLNRYLRDDGNLRPEFLKTLRAQQAAGKWGLPPRQMQTITCADGLTFSAQASKHHYCSPRKNIGPYSAVEIGFPSQRVEEFMPYAENPDDPTQTVYGWVPVEVVEEVVNSRGGIATPCAAN